MDSRDRLDDLLSDGRLSAPANERMFGRIYAATGGARRRWIIAALAPALGAAAVLLVARPHSKDAEGFRPKGGEAGLIELECAGGSLSSCPMGSPLIFRADGLTSPVFLQAYAEGGGGDRIWFFPTAVTPALAVSPAPRPQVLRQAVRFGEHTGRYDVHVVVSTAPLDRAAVLEGRARTILDEHVTAVRIVGP